MWGKLLLKIAEQAHNVMRCVALWACWSAIFSRSFLYYNGKTEKTLLVGSWWSNLVGAVFTKVWWHRFLGWSLAQPAVTDQLNSGICMGVLKGTRDWCTAFMSHCSISKDHCTLSTVYTTVMYIYRPLHWIYSCMRPMDCIYRRVYSIYRQLVQVQNWPLWPPIDHCSTSVHNCSAHVAHCCDLQT